MIQRYAETESEIELAQRSIMEKMKESGGRPIAPGDVINDARERGQVSESVVRSTIWFLLDQDVISLTRDRKLVVTSRT